MSELTAPHVGLIRRLLGEGNERVHAAVILVSCVTLCACALVLAGAAAAGRTVSVEFAAAVGAVSGLAGWAYGKAKQVGAAAPPATENGAVSERPAMDGSAKIQDASVCWSARWDAREPSRKYGLIPGASPSKIARPCDTQTPLTLSRETQP